MPTKTLQESQPARPQGKPQPTLPMGKVELEVENRQVVQLKVEVATQPHQQQMGLMFRESMPEDTGMLFLFPASRHQSFWMRNTLIPLDMFFIDSNWKVVGVVEHAEPLTDEPREVEGESQYVLEVNAGFAKKHGFGAGTKVRVTPEAGTPASSSPAPLTVTRRPTSPDPLAGQFALADALAGLAGKGAPKATIETSLGTLTCKLWPDKAPLTVANFVGLARGLRPFWDGRSATWAKRPLFDGTTFHRVIPGFMIQGGDHLGDGTGDVGYNVIDELHPSLSHDRAGLLCMANKGPNTNGGQFFITDAAAPHLTQMKSYSIFGECGPVEVIHRIANAPKLNPMGERPEPAVVIKQVTIAR